MNKKLYVSLVAIVLIGILSSCSPKHLVVEETYDDGTPKRECVYQGEGEDRILLKETFFYPNQQIEMTGAYQDGERHDHWSD